jgi:pimeloyl-ACP methyl ester carboxylesterase
MTRGRRIARGLLLPALVVAMLSAAMQFGCADRLLLHPSRRAVPSIGTRTLVPFGDGMLATYVARGAGEEPQGYVLAFTGNGGRAEYEVGLGLELYEGAPIEIVAVNPPGYGASDGDASLGTLSPSALAAYDHLAARAGGRPIVVYGNSMGAAVALSVASRRPAAALVLRNPPPLRSLVLQRHGWWNLWLLAIPVALAIPSDLDAVDNARNCEVPALFLRASHDQVVPPAYQEEVFAAYLGAKTLIEYRGGHNDGLGVALGAARAAARNLLPRP